jgi:hypothetical protein
MSCRPAGIDGLRRSARWRRAVLPAKMLPSRGEIADLRAIPTDRVRASKLKKAPEGDANRDASHSAPKRTDDLRAGMNRPAPKTLRRRFLLALGHALSVTWPVLSAILAIQVTLGLLIGFVEGWTVGDAIYFAFVTGLTIGYGDIVPRQALTRALAVGIGISGLFLTGLIAGIAVYAMRTALSEPDTG